MVMKERTLQKMPNSEHKLSISYPTPGVLMLSDVAAHEIIHKFTQLSPPSLPLSEKCSSAHCCRHYHTSQKVAGSIPDEVIEFFF
jgi:hypothetical protein